MNIDIANRLYEYRKQNNLSQEELAQRIGVSRQAVSKWERAESSPDTDNLIELAKLYGVSLDDLLFTAEPTKKESSDSNDEEEKWENPEYVSVGLSGIHVIDGSDEVHVSWKDGIQVKSNGEFEFDSHGMSIGEKLMYNLPVPILAIVYLIMGFVWDLWHPGWIIFLAILVYYPVLSTITSHRKKKKSEREEE